MIFAAPFFIFRLSFVVEQFVLFLAIIGFFFLRHRWFALPCLARFPTRPRNFGNGSGVKLVFVFEFIVSTFERQTATIHT